MRFFWKVSSLLVWGIFFSSSVSLAQESDKNGIGISIHPFLSDLILEEGETEQPFTIEVSNFSSADAEFFLTAVDFGSLDASAGVAFLGSDRDMEKSLENARWIRLDTESIALKRGESKALQGKLVDSPELAPGGHYGAILFRSKGEIIDFGPTNVNVDQRVAALVFIRKNGGALFGLEIREWEVAKKWGSPLSLSTLLKNTGNTHVTPRGKAELRDPLGRTVSKGILNENSLIILPKTEKEFLLALSSVKTAWIPGMYELSFDVRYDGKESFEGQSMDIFLIPWRSILPLAIFLVTGFCFLYRKEFFRRESGA